MLDDRAGNEDCVATGSQLRTGARSSEILQRWVQHLDPTIVKGIWTAEEDAKLTSAIKKQGKDWVAVAAEVPGRTNRRFSERWRKHLDPSKKGIPIDEEHEDRPNLVAV